MSSGMLSAIMKIHRQDGVPPTPTSRQPPPASETVFTSERQSMP